LDCQLIQKAFPRSLAERLFQSLAERLFQSLVAADRSVAAVWLQYLLGEACWWESEHGFL
jgi:hypothetical protein